MTVDWHQKIDREENGNKTNLKGLEALPAWDMYSHIFQVLSHLCLRTSLEVYVGISPGVQLGTLTGCERKGLIQDGDQLGNGRRVWAHFCQLRAAHTAWPGAVCMALWYNWVRPGAGWVRDEQSGSWGLCTGLSTVSTRKRPPGCEVSSSIADPKRTQNPLTRHITSSKSATASWGSRG